LHFEPTYKNILDFYTPESAQILERAVRQAVETDESYDVELTLITATGQLLQVRAIGSTRSRDGRVVKMIGVLQDITEKKQIEEARRRSEQFYRALFEQSNDAIVLTNLDGSHFAANPQVAQIFGYSAEEIVAKSYQEMILESELADTEHILRNILSGEAVPIYERTLKRKDGSTFLGEVNIQLIQDNFNMPYIQSIVRDVTERKKAEDALRTERNLLHMLMENIPDTIYFKDSDSRFTRVNQAECHLLGVDNPDDMIGKMDSDFQAPDLAALFYAEEQQLFTTGEPIIDRIEYNPMPDGTPRWLSATKMPIKDEKGHVIGLVGISRNITERKLVEDALRESEQRYRLLAENTNDLVTLQDTKGIFLYVSPSFERLMGYSSEELNGPKRGTFVDSEFHPVILHASQRVIKGETVTRLEYRAYKKTGEAVWLEANVVPIWDVQGQVRQLLSSTRDVTINKRMQQTLLENSRRFRALIENSYDLILLVDITGKITYISPSSIRITGYPDTAFVGDVDSQALANLVHPDDLAAVIDFFMDLASYPGVSRVIQRRLIHADGHAIWVQGIGTNLLEQPGIEAVVINAREITESVQAFEAERDQRRFAETLLDSLAALSGTLEFDEVLANLLNNIGQIIPHDYANIALVEKAFMRVVGVRGYSVEQESLVSSSRYAVLKTPNLRRMLETHQPLLIPDTAHYPGWRPILPPGEVRSYLGIPILLNDGVIGFINLESKQANFFTQHTAERLKVFANQVAIAIKNARAYEQAQELATVRERQRLARDLHDAVSQTLFSANVIAETLPLLFDMDADEVKSGLGQLARLTKGALAEMRTLLVELRPSALLETDLTVLLTHLVNGFRSRTQAQVEFFVDGSEHPMPADTRVCFYRITQEALHNVIKHARAAHIRLNLEFDLDQVKLEVLDNGAGFDPDEVSAAHLGLRIMKERADGAEIALSIKSEPGQGTHISALWIRQYNND
ncbi:MAG: PAS domain S-box protein, partial [Chitinophagaceae bacterium]|nr:PAS domain S-box protein [Anaerolineae bacterium]